MSAKLEGPDQFLVNFFPCNFLGIMLNFDKVEGMVDPSVLPFLRPGLLACTTDH